MAGIPFEYLLMAIESARGTAETTPTKMLNLLGSLMPKKSYWRPEESTGTLAASHRSKVTRQWGEVSAEGPLELNGLLVLAQSLMGAVASPSTPTNGVLTRLWEFLPDMTSDSREGLTAWGGDPNIQIWRSPFLMVEEVGIISDTSGEDGSTMSISGRCNFPAKVSAPTAPALDNAPLLAAMNMQAFIDTSSAIGTTELTGRIVSAEHTLTCPVALEFLTTGAGGGLDFSSISLAKSSITTRLTLTVPDTTQYDHFADEDTVKLRVRHNGPLIESVTPDYYYKVEVDTYGKFELVDFGDLEGASRTISFEVSSEYDTTLAADWRLAIQSTETALP